MLFVEAGKAIGISPEEVETSALEKVSVSRAFRLRSVSRTGKANIGDYEDSHFNKATVVSSVKLTGTNSQKFTS